MQQDCKTPEGSRPDTNYATRPFDEITDRRNRSFLLGYRLALKVENASAKTMEHYVSAARDFMLFAEQHELPGVLETSATDLRLWLAAYKDRGRASATVKNRYVGCRQFFKWLWEEEDMAPAPFPFDKIKQPKVEAGQKRVLGQEDFGRVFKHLEAKKRWRDAAIIAFLYDTGMRCSETCSLMLTNINTDTGLVRLEAETTKGRRWRVVRVSPTTLVYINRYLRQTDGRRHDPEYLFTGTKGRFTRDGLRNVVIRCFAEIGLKGSKATGDGIGAHTMRHSSATHQAGLISETEMMDLFGWKVSDMARLYTATARQAVALAAHERSSPMTRLQASKRR